MTFANPPKSKPRPIRCTRRRWSAWDVTLWILTGTLVAHLGPQLIRLIEVTP